jgi:hypothetical protein
VLAGQRHDARRVSVDDDYYIGSYFANLPVDEPSSQLNETRVLGFYSRDLVGRVQGWLRCGGLRQ